MTNGTCDKPVCLLCGSLIDGSGGPVRRRVMLYIRNGLISAIEEVSGKVAIPSPSADFGDCTIIPGLVDCHVHLFMSGTTDRTIRERQLKYSFGEVRSIIARHLDSHLKHGILAVRDGGDYGGHAMRYKREVMAFALKPIVVRCAGRAWHAPGRYGKLIGRPTSPGMTLAESIGGMDERPDHIKVVNSGINSLTVFGRETATQFSRRELSDAVKAGGKLGLKCMVHANGRLPVEIAIHSGCHSIEHGFFMQEQNLHLLADRQICWVPTVGTMKAYSEHVEKGSREAVIASRNLDHQLDQMSLARRLGVPMVIGTDCGSLGVHHGSAFAEEIKLFIEAGFTLPEAIRCATFNGAALLGIDHEMGELKVGMPATMLAVKGTPDALPEALKKPLAVFYMGHRI
ncbi:MAG TPA: amidohydrolase family protein [Dissulfurispiraceae bacterium]|nr:amidohydrolase family protein [Dissulfurispiraceae bacterium]